MRHEDGHRRRIPIRTAAWLVRHYPTPWRARYEDEVLLLLDDSPVRWRDVVDLTRGLVTERALSLFEPGDHPLRTSFTLAFLPLPVVVMCWVAGALAGAGLRTAFGPVRVDGGFFTALLALAGVSLQVFWHSRYARFDLTPWAAATSSPSPSPEWSRKVVRFGLLWFCGVLVDAVLTHWARPEPLFSSPFPLLILFGAAAHLPLNRRYPELRYAVTRLQQLKILMKWARLELQRCETLHEQGAASPLEEARTEVHRLEEQRNEARATLHAMGYRARFR